MATEARETAVQQLQDELARLQAGADVREVGAGIRASLASLAHAEADHIRSIAGGPRNGLVLDVCHAVKDFVEGAGKVTIEQLMARLWHIRNCNPAMLGLPRQMIADLERIITPATQPEDLRPYMRPPAARPGDPDEPIIQPHAGLTEMQGTR